MAHLSQMGQEETFADLWSALGGDARARERVSFGGVGELPSVYAVTDLAVAQITAAVLAITEVHAARTGEAPRPVHVERGHAVAAFRSERYLRAIGWEIPAPWDPIAGDYRAKDGWIRLHTNYAYHRDAALGVLGTRNEKDDVTRAVAMWDKDTLEAAVVAAGGCAAAMHTAAEWRAHPQGAAVAREPLVAVEAVAAPAPSFAAAPGAPLAGVRVLDLTRVIAGPVCTRVLAAYGADVMRVDPPGFQEVGALLSETTAGKRRTSLDLRRAGDRVAFEALVAGAHVLVVGYRGDVLERLGYDLATLRRLNPSLVVAALDAYGWSGPWHSPSRRGFNSLVQMTCGIAARGQEMKGAEAPFPLPAQALDHGTGYLLAAATCRALVRAITAGEATSVRVSLARTAGWLMDIGEQPTLDHHDFTVRDAAPWTEEARSPWGRLSRVRCPGRIAGIAAEWSRPPGALGVDAPVW